MDGLRDSAMAIISAALICGIVTQMLQGSAARELIRLLCGIFIAVTILFCFRKVDYQALLEPVQSDLRQAEDYTAAGKEMAGNAVRDIIKQNCEAYVLDKATEMAADITVDITLSEDEIPIPNGITICGKITPYAKLKLGELLTEELGIAREDQQWIG